MKHNRKVKRGNKNSHQNIHKHSPRELQSGWARWCPGQGIGRGEEEILVQYSDGTGEHDNLHERGCRVEVFRRRVDIDELYESTPWLLCPFGGEEEACTCMRCRTEK